MTKTSPAPREKSVKRNCSLPREKFGELGPSVASFPFYLFWKCEAGGGNPHATKGLRVSGQEETGGEARGRRQRKASPFHDLLNITVK